MRDNDCSVNLAKFLTSKFLLIEVVCFFDFVMPEHDDLMFFEVNFFGLAGMGPSLSQTRGALRVVVRD